MKEIHLVAILYAKEGCEDALRADLTTVTRKSAQEDGNIRYELFADANDSRRFVLVEQWRDAERSSITIIRPILLISMPMARKMSNVEKPFTCSDTSFDLAKLLL